MHGLGAVGTEAHALDSTRVAGHPLRPPPTYGEARQILKISLN